MDICAHSQHTSMNNVYLMIGGNIGDRLVNLEIARKNIEQRCGAIQKQSSIFETEAWGYKDQPAFYNQALCIESALSPQDLMETLLAIEQAMGRERLIPLGPRTIDLDILYYNQTVIETPALIIPHPRLSERNFVLVPLMEIAPDFVHPILKKTNTALYNASADVSVVHKKTNL